MDLNQTPRRTAGAPLLPTGIDHALLENDGPRAFGDRMGAPAPDERVLWKGRPALAMLARTAFHTRTAGLYMTGLIAVALASGNNDAAIVAAVLGIALIALLYGLAWLSARTTLYILTDVRLILRIGMAIETRVNIPLKQIEAADLRLRGKGHGDIALELAGDRLLGYALLWPHARAWRFARPQPMLRCVPEAAALAALIGDARAQYGAITRNPAAINEVPAAGSQQRMPPRIIPGRIVPAHHRSEPGLEGAPA